MSGISRRAVTVLAWCFCCDSILANRMHVAVVTAIMTAQGEWQQGTVSLQAVP